METKKVIAKIKDGLNGKLLKSLRAKMYSLKTKKKRNEEGKKIGEERSQKRH